jgi:hypothetical protein
MKLRLLRHVSCNFAVSHTCHCIQHTTLWNQGFMDSSTNGFWAFGDGAAIFWYSLRMHNKHASWFLLRHQPFIYIHMHSVQESVTSQWRSTNRLNQQGHASVVPSSSLSTYLLSVDGLDMVARSKGSVWLDPVKHGWRSNARADKKCFH